MTPRRIAFLTSPLGLGGSEQQLFHVLSGIDRTQFTPIVIQLGGDLREHWVAPIRDLDITVLGLDRSTTRVSRIRRLARLLRDQHVDIVHSWPRFANPYAAVAGRLAGTSVRIGSIREDPVGLNGSAATHSLMSAGLDVIVTNWRGALEKVPAWVAKRTVLHVVHNGVALPGLSSEADRVRLRAELGFAESDLIVGSIGRLDGDKNAGMMLRVFSALAPKWPHLRLAILGGGPERETLLRVAGSLGVSERVALPGRIAQAARFLPAFDVCCLTSLTEGLPNVVMEASAAGIPVVSTACGGVRELIDHGVTGYVVPQQDLTAMTACVDQLLSDGAQAKAMGARARAKMQREFSVSKMVASTMAMYEDALRIATTGKRRQVASHVAP